MIKMDIKSASPQWAKAAMEIFRNELETGDIKLCENIYNDVLDAGHYPTAREMKTLLDNRK